MRVKILSPYPSDIVYIFKNDEIVYEFERADYVVSYGHQTVLPPSFVNQFKNRAINLHISLLPWNRGRDPNFWSWFDSTPKGVSLHFIDEGIDTGPLIAQAHVDMMGYETLETSYWRLRRAAVRLLESIWPNLPEPQPQTGVGTYHVGKERLALWHHFPLGWQTPCEFVEEFGMESNLSESFWTKYYSEIEAQR